MTATRPEREPAWVLELTIADDIAVCGDVGVGRESFIEWLWTTLGDDGLAGVFEGEVDVESAAAAGLVAAALVLDAAEAPADRDWVAGVNRGDLVCWFAEEAAARRAAAMLAEVPGCRVAGLRAEAGEPDDEAWRRSFGPIDVPGFGRILPAWEPGEAAVTADGTTMFLEPGTGFGTGLHETTQLCLAAIRGWREAGGRMDRVLDFGSGSGVLGIAAAVLGATHVDAVEVDDRVHGAIAGNANRNGVVDRVAVTSHLPPGGEGYDLIVANIVADVLLRHADELCGLVRRGADGVAHGGVVLSGLLAADVASVAAAFAARLGHTPIEGSLGAWHCLRFEPRSACGGGDECR